MIYAYDQIITNQIKNRMNRIIRKKIGEKKTKEIREGKIYPADQ